MQIHSLAKLLVLPLVLVAFAIYYYSETIGHREDSVYLMIPGIALVLLYVFKPQIDYWYHKRNPLPLDDAIVKWLAKYFLFYNSLPAEEKGRFEQRMSLFMEAKSFNSMGSERRGVPEDIAGILSAFPVMLTFYEEDFLWGTYDYFYLYKHPFPSPKKPYLHTAEVDHEDGVMIFSLEHLLPPYVNPEKFYHIGLHILLEAHREWQKWPKLPEITPDVAEEYFPFTIEQIKTTLGEKSIDFQIVTAVFSILFPESMHDYDPSLSLKYRELFNFPKE